MRAFLFFCRWLLLAAGCFLLLLGAFTWYQSHRAQTQIALHWDRDLEVVPPAAPPGARTPHPGSPVARLTIPRLRAVLYVVEGADSRDLERGPGHLTGTVLPGDDGNCVIAGHRDTHFRVLRKIRQGDEIVLERAGKTFRYRVDAMSVVAPANTSSLLPTPAPVLTLVTCFPFEYIGPAPRRFIVRAALEAPSAPRLPAPSQAAD